MYYDQTVIIILKRLALFLDGIWYSLFKNRQSKINIQIHPINV